MKSLLNAVTFSWDAYFTTIFGSDQNAIDAAKAAVDIIETALWIIIGVVGLAAIVYAIYLGINLAKASEQGKRDEARKHLITVVIAIVVTLVLVVFFLYLLPGILGAFHSVEIAPTP